MRLKSGIRSTVKGLHGKEAALLFVIVVLFAIGGTTFGMAEEALVFIPMLVPLAIAMGYDSLTGLALALVGPCAGFTGAFLNPFTVAVAQGIVGLPIFSGMSYRIVIWVCTTLLAFVFIYMYAQKVKKNPQISIMYEEDQKRAKIDLDTEAPFTGRHKLVLVFMLLTFVVLIWGVVKYGWWIDEIAALFLSMGLICGLIGGLWPSKIAESFVEGAMSLTVGALVVGIARAILVVLVQGGILHTIVYFLANLVSGLPIALSHAGHVHRAAGHLGGHTFRLWYGIRDHADHGSTFNLAGHDPAAGCAHLPVCRRLHEHHHPHLGLPAGWRCACQSAL